MALKLELQLEPRVEERLRDLAAKTGINLDEYVARLVESCFPAPPAPVLTGEAWERELRAWAASHKPLSTPVDDSRESIYQGRGE
jgi:hypothetical protein